MKKTGKPFLLLLILALTVSCSKESMQDGNDLLSETAFVASFVSDGGTAPVQLNGSNNGGNITCEEVAFEKGAEFLFSTGRVEYKNGSFVFEDGTTGWPEGLEVTVTDNKSVSFTYNSTKYSVGAVIVKGGNKSNVYYYPNGTTGDAGLTSPSSANKKGKIILPDVSNITFCFLCGWEVAEAWGAGSLYTEMQGEWATYTPHGIQGQPVPLLTQEGIQAGNIYFGGDMGSYFRIDISLINGWRFVNNNTPIQIQDYLTVPVSYPDPDQFSYKFGFPSGNYTYTYIKKGNYYGIHVDVERKGCDSNSE